ncbi:MULTISPECIES: lysylphosphatidylglycerol synthase domain-containing protein [unclassified Nocardioides]|uniref:lysylphosphatidylglycerol synthase domain-containing protein n=1 Tax=unclassified Nocardioides TaxID=2615069 RepID=UPI0006F25D10|nr:MULTISPECIES: lysylphosphatidylglycerol synthase domain-containing protein [unclassified Nocardioides]
MSRGRLMDLLRGVFLVAVLGFAFWGLHDRGGELLDTVQRTSVVGLVVAAALVLAGLLVTSVAWLRLLAGYGHRMPPGEGQRVFFVGQLGKYIPGSVWSMGAHADLARGFDVPMRVTVGTSLMFLWLNLATSGLVAGLLAVSGWWRPGLRLWLVVLGLIGCVVGLLPPVVERIGSRLAGASGRLRLTWGAVGVLVGLMAVTWTCYAAATIALAPTPSVDLFPVAAGAFTAAYAVGVLVVLAPAGIGAREVTLVALLAPVTGVTTATALALLTRALLTGGDLLLALLAWAVVRATRRRAVVSDPTVGGGWERS